MTKSKNSTPKKSGSGKTPDKSGGQTRLDAFFGAGGIKSAQTPSPSPAPTPVTPAAKTAEIIDLSDDEQNAVLEPPAKRARLSPTPTPCAVLSLQSAPSAPSASQSITTKLFTYDPAILPLEWANGGAAPYSFVASTFAAIDAESSRTAILCALTNAFRSLLVHSPADVLPLLYLASNSIAPSYEGIELGIGGQVLGKAIRDVTGATPATMKSMYDRLGDLGDVAMELRVKQRTLFTPKPLSLAGVYATLRKIAGLRGQGTTDDKANLVKAMLVSARGEEIRYLVRTLLAHIRIGATKTTSLTALANAVVVHSGWDSVAKPNRTSRLEQQLREKMKTAEATIKQVFARLPNYGTIVSRLLDPAIGLERLAEACSCQPGVPIKAMLGKITRDLSEALAKIEGKEFVADFKYDGMRAQIHRRPDGSYEIFSRHLERVTERYPDILAVLPEAEKEGTESYILDAEIVAWDPIEKHILPFQSLANRPRKSVKIEDLKTQAKVFVFDIMFLNGESLLGRSLRERLGLLGGAFREVEDRFAQVERMFTLATPENADSTSDFFKRALQSGAEGLMLKLLEPPPDSKKGSLVASYEPDKRLDSWLKVKQDYDASFRTFDLVVMGAWWGNGRKAGWYSPFLLGCYDPKTERIEAVCKIISGFSDAFYREQLEVFSEESGRLANGKKSYFVTDYECDVWFEPSVVWEIRGADLTLSPTHPAARGLVAGDRGVSLRFPRFVRVREDKGVEEATSSEEIAEAYGKQVLVMNRERSEGRKGKEKDDKEDEEEGEASMEEADEAEGSDAEEPEMAEGADS